MQIFLKSLIVCYRLFLSPLLVSLFGKQCRYEVSCSQFALNALDREKPMKALQLIVRRILSCQPYGASL